MSKQTELAQVADTITVDSGNVGIGASSPSTKLEILTTSSGDQPLLTLHQNNNTSGNEWGIDFKRLTDVGGANDTVARINAARFGGDASGLKFYVNNSGGTLAEAMRIDSSGNLLVGTTDSAGTRYSATSGGGTVIQPSSYSVFSRETTASNQAIMTINNTGVDAIFTEFLKDGTTVGSIGTHSSTITAYQGAGATTVGGGDVGLFFSPDNDNIIPVTATASATRDNAIDLGASNGRFDDIFATNGTIQTSDRNEKQDIDVLSDAEQRVAVACKGLLRKFRWRDAVEAKGDDARTHFGIIAQDLQAAFAAEGLDAGDYAMFISTTWWETQTEVPAVEAVAEVLDDDGNVVTEAVEAVDAYTRTDTYDIQEEAPEGATERTRLGVRYSELLAFIIGAL